MAFTLRAVTTCAVPAEVTSVADVSALVPETDGSFAVVTDPVAPVLRTPATPVADVVDGRGGPVRG